MVLIRNSTVLSAAPEEAFDYLSDLRSEEEWNPICEDAEKITDGPIGVGTKFRMEWERTPDQVVEVVDFQRPHTWTMHSEGDLEVTFTGTLEPVAEGTRLQVDFDAQPHGWFRLIFPVFVFLLRRHERENMRRLQKAFDRQVVSS